MINPNDHYNGNYKWLKAKLPDGYIGWVTENESAPGMYISDEGGDVFEEKDLEFLDNDYLYEELKKLLKLYTKEEVINTMQKIEIFNKI
jgi:hypothetical protein